MSRLQSLFQILGPVTLEPLAGMLLEKRLDQFVQSRRLWPALRQESPVPLPARPTVYTVASTRLGAVTPECWRQKSRKAAGARAGANTNPCPSWHPS